MQLPTSQLHRRSRNSLRVTAFEIAVCAVTALLVLPPESAYASCPDDWLKFHESSGDGQLVLTAENFSIVPLTFTMEIDLTRLSASRDTTFTESLQPRESKNIVTLSRIDESEAGNYHYKTRCTIGNIEADHDDDVVYMMPYARNKSYRVLQGYGSRFSHTGREAYAVDFYMEEGTPVHAARAGMVATVEESHSIGCWRDGCGKYANFIIIVHEDDTTGEYYHLQKNGALVEPGQQVTAGQLIGRSGNTGHTTMPHLHFGVYRAVTWGREQSIPVRFLTQDGIIDRPRRGGRYLATTGARQDENDDAVLPGQTQHLD